MALALRLRRALAAASTSAPLLRPGGVSSAAAASRSLPLAPLVRPLPLPWTHLPGAAAGFRSTAATATRDGNYGGGRDDNKINPDEILFEGCDYNHWLITMEFPDPKPSREEMIETYLQTLAKVVGSYEEAKKRMYALSTTTYIGFQAVMTEEMSEKFRGLPGVVFILPDSYLYPETKEYGGDKYENGVITPRPPPIHYSKPSRTDRNRNFRGNYQDNSPPHGNYQNSPQQGNYQNSAPQQGNYQNRPPHQNNYQNRPPLQGNYQNSPPQQGNYQNSPPQQGNYQNSPPQQGNFQTYRPQQDGRGYAPQPNYVQAAQGDTGYGRNDYAQRSGNSGTPGGYQGPSPQYQEQVNQVGQGQGYYNPQERRNFSQGQAGDFRPGGPSTPGTYGQPSAPGNYGQPPAPTYTGGNHGGSGVNRGFGGDNSHGAGPANGRDNQHGSSGQYGSPSEGQEGNWQARQ